MFQRYLGRHVPVTMAMRHHRLKEGLRPSWAGPERGLAAPDGHTRRAQWGPPAEGAQWGPLVEEPGQPLCSSKGPLHPAQLPLWPDHRSSGTDSVA